jgi:hypothetical protein
VRGYILMLLLLVAGAVALRAASPTRDIQFVCGHVTPIDACLNTTSAIHFNGDWRGIELCRAGQCVKFETIFKESR